MSGIAGFAARQPLRCIATLWPDLPIPPRLAEAVQSGRPHAPHPLIKAVYSKQVIPQYQLEVAGPIEAHDVAPVNDLVQMKCLVPIPDNSYHTRRFAPVQGFPKRFRDPKTRQTIKSIWSLGRDRGERFRDGVARKSYLYWLKESTGCWGSSVVQRRCVRWVRAPGDGFGRYTARGRLAAREVFARNVLLCG
jgi:hypothetical protein